MSNAVKLGELVGLHRGQSYKSALLGGPGPVLLGLGTIRRNGGFRGDNLRTYGGDSPERILLRGGDLYVSLKDMTHAADLLGAVARVPDSIESGRLTQDTVRVEIVSDRVRPDYLYWALQTPRYRAYCRSRGTGTTNLDLSRDDFFSYAICLPSLEGQRAIVEVLGALDDKITANVALAVNLDDLACSMFDMAIHGVPMSDNTFGDIAEIRGGGTPKTSVPEYWGGDVWWATPTDVTALPGPYLRRTSRTITPDGLANCSSSLYPPGSLLMTSRATIGAFAFSEVPVAVNQGFIVVNPHDEGLRYWVAHEMRSRVDEFISRANGATFLELSRGKFKMFNVRLTSNDAMQRFNELAAGIHSAANAALAENDGLANVRDALLPELMSGRLRVKDAEKRVGEVL